MNILEACFKLKDHLSQSTKIKKKDGEIVHISQTANQILSKVQFCLDAKKHIGDAVFWNQVPDQMKKEIERD